MQAAGRHDTVFAGQAADLVRLRRALTDQLRADAVHRLDILLCRALQRHEAHPRAAHGFADRLGVQQVVLVALHVGLDELRGDELHAQPPPLELAPPMVRRTARLHANLHTRGALRAQHINPLISLEFCAPLHAPVTVDGMHVKNGLRNVDTRSANLHLGLLLIP